MSALQVFVDSAFKNMNEEKAMVVETIRRRIDAACRRCGRDPESVRLVAVTKTVPAERIVEAAAAGIKIFGENYIQEALPKIKTVGRGVSWHFIGHLQSNKAKQAVECFDMIHSVDSLRLAESLEKAAAARGRVVPVLVQINIAGEASKHGIAPQEAESFIKRIGEFPHVHVRGLMAIPPLMPSPEDSRPYYRALRQLRDEVHRWLPENTRLSELSMGMSSDFEVAIEEGATLVRIGTALFGERPRTGVCD